MTVFEKIEAQQAKLKDTEPAWMVGEQLKDICRADPHCADIVTEDLENEAMSLEKQLHGYGNERHGQYKQYTHSIPQKVRNFCDRWKNEVLIPWYVEQQKKQEVKSA